MLVFQGDFDWMMLGYADDKKNTLRLVCVCVCVCLCVCVCVCRFSACDLYFLMLGYADEKKNTLCLVRLVLNAVPRRHMYVYVYIQRYDCMMPWCADD
jgi:hypothetical protein